MKYWQMYLQGLLNRTSATHQELDHYRQLDGAQQHSGVSFQSTFLVPQFCHQLQQNCPNYLKRSFPYSNINFWNSLQVTIFPDEPAAKRLISFKFNVNKHIINRCTSGVMMLRLCVMILKLVSGASPVSLAQLCSSTHLYHLHMPLFSSFFSTYHVCPL